MVQEDNTSTHSSPTPSPLTSPLFSSRRGERERERDKESEGASVGSVISKPPLVREYVCMCACVHLPMSALFVLGVKE